MFEKLGTLVNNGADCLLRAVESIDPDTPVRLWGAYAMQQFERAIIYHKRVGKLIREIWETGGPEVPPGDDDDDDTIDTPLWTPDLKEEGKGGAV